MYLFFSATIKVKNNPSYVTSCENNRSGSISVSYYLNKPWSVIFYGSRQCAILCQGSRATNGMPWTAGTMIVFYASHFSSPGKRIVVWCDDADDMELLLHHQVHISGMICMDMGLSSKNYRWIIDIILLPEALPCN